MLDVEAVRGRSKGTSCWEAKEFTPQEETAVVTLKEFVDETFVAEVLLLLRDMFIVGTAPGCKTSVLA